jgi:hypothetical protein
MDYDDLSRRMGSEKRQKLQVWKAGSEAERIALYRRVWGPAWRSRSTDLVPDETTSREELINRNLIVVETIAATLVRAGQNPFIEKDDLLQVGYAELIRTIDRRENGALALEKRIARNCKTVMIRFIERELRERRYVQHGKLKAVRDNRAALGRPASESDNRGESVAPNPAEEFLYPEWLLGAVSVCHLERAYVFEDLQKCDLPRELADIAHRVGYQFKQIPEGALRSYVRPKLECLRHTPLPQRSSQDMLQDSVLV